MNYEYEYPFQVSETPVDFALGNRHTMNLQWFKHRRLFLGVRSLVKAEASSGPRTPVTPTYEHLFFGVRIYLLLCSCSLPMAIYFLFFSSFVILFYSMGLVLYLVLRSTEYFSTFFYFLFFGVSLAFAFSLF